MTVSNLRLVLGVQHGLRVAAEIGAGHRHDVRFVARHELPHVLAQPVVRVGGDVVELVHGDQAVVEGFDAELLHREAERGVRADQHLVVAFQELLHRVHLAAVVAAGRVAQIPSSAPPVQSAQKPDWLSGSSWKLAPMDRSGTTMIACLRP